MKKQIRTQLNFNFNPATDMEAGGGISETIPDQATSLKDLINDYVRTGNIPRGSAGAFYGEENLEIPENFTKLDMTEQVDIIEENKQKLKNAQNKTNNEAKNKKEQSDQNPPKEESTTPLV